jgi:LL-H family phage holin
MSETSIILISQILLPVLFTAGLYILKAIEANMPQAQRSYIANIVQMAVQCVEQAAPALSGADKREQALSLVSTLLGQAGIKASPELISTLIESSVFAMNQSRMTVQTARTPAVQKQA